MSRPSRHHHAASDPLEAAKIPAPAPAASQPARPEVQAAPSAFPDPAAGAPPQAPATEDRPTPAAPATPSAPGPASKRYRVKASTHVSLNGQLTRLNPGDIVSEETYGPMGMSRILESNVPLEEVQ